MFRQTKFSSFGTSIIDTQENSNTYGRLGVKPPPRPTEGVAQSNNFGTKESSDFKQIGMPRALSREGGPKPEVTAYKPT